MSNDYYNYGNTFIPGDLARAEDVKNEFEGVQGAFDRLPTPRSDGTGFAVPVVVEDGVEVNHAATFGQVQNIGVDIESAKLAAQTAQAAAELARDLAEDYKDTAETEATRAENANVTLDGVLESASASAAAALVSKNLAADWAIKPIGQTVSGAGTRSALHYSDLSKQYATKDYGVNVEGTDKSAKHWALEAAATVSGAKRYIGFHSAAGGTYPIATPTIADKGKFWIINIAGTLPLGAVAVGWELSINDALAYQAANLNPGMITSVNAKTGPSVTLTPGDIGASPSSHTHTQYLEKVDNLATLPNKATSRANLGLGTSAVLDTGVAAGQIPVRDGTGSTPGNITGNALSATSAGRLTTARTISLTGDATGSVSTDLSGNTSIAVEVVNDSHTHSGITSKPDYAPPFDSGNRPPRDYFNAGLCRVFITGNNATPASGWPVDYGVLINIPGYTAGQDGGAMQILSRYSPGYTLNGNFQFRIGNFDNAGWSAWKTVLDKAYGDVLYLAKSAAAASANRLANARTITLSGDVSGTSSPFDGSANISINTTQSASSLLTKIKTVDGAGSGLDADLLDGLQASDFVRTSNFNAIGPSIIWTGAAASLATSVLPGSGMYTIRVRKSNDGKEAWGFIHYLNGTNCTSTPITIADGSSPWGWVTLYAGTMRFIGSNGTIYAEYQIMEIRRIA